VVAIGQGLPAMAADFKKKFKIPHPLLVDQKRTTYKALQLKKGKARDIVNPGVLAKGTLEVLKGNIQGVAPKGTSMTQLGGVVIVDKGGEIVFTHRSQNAADNLPVDEVMASLP